MTKSETVNQFLNLSRNMDNMMKQLEADFKHECKAIQNITINLIDKFCIDYIDDRTKIALFYTIDDPFILHAMDRTSERNNVACYIDFVSETFVIPNREEYLEFLNTIKLAANGEIISLNKQIEILNEKNKSFWFRITHPNSEIAINNITEARKKIEEVQRVLKFEIDNMSNGIIEQMITTFIEEVKHTYGFMDLKLTSGDDFGGKDT